MKQSYLVISALLLHAHPCWTSEFPPACNDAIYCIGGPGTILHTMARIYPDSKTFVDMPLIKSRDAVMQDFNQMMQDNNNNPDKETVLAFVERNFGPRGTEFEPWDPEDWTATPALLDMILDPEYRSFASDINSRWKELGRKIPATLSGANSTTLIYLENPFIVPGGRFLEMYYWDSYWTILGLLQSEMTTTIKGMLSNFVHLIETIGWIPNGSRVYFNQRSQPPLFIAMVDEYVKSTGDEDFVRDNIQALEAEFLFWTRNRTQKFEVNGKQLELARYSVTVRGPRPESYYEDYSDGQNFADTDDKEEFYRNMHSGAESGLDYSSKWFVNLGGDSNNLLDIKTTHIIPVELNAYLCRSSRIMKNFYEDILHDEDKAAEFQAHYDNFYAGLSEFLWSDEHGTWLDYDTINNKKRAFFYPTNVAPLWAGCFNETQASRAVQYLKSSDSINYPGGVPSSMRESGQQWDFANAWPPQQELLITGLENVNTAEASDLAFDLAQKWVYNNWLTYVQTDQIIFEKYNVTQVGPGGAGEYDVQKGFGWTNGVLLSLFAKYGHKLSSTEESTTVSMTTSTTSTAGLAAFPSFMLLGGRKEFMRACD